MFSEKHDINKIETPEQAKAYALLLDDLKQQCEDGIQKINDVWELNRFCSHSDYNVIGIASKLLTWFKRNYSWSEVFSYADRRWSTGNLYYKIGFELVSETQPNYWYIDGLRRIHRFNLRKTSSDPKEKPEQIIRKEQGYNRIWDCGNLKFRMVNTL